MTKAKTKGLFGGFGFGLSWWVIVAIIVFLLIFFGLFWLGGGA
ncbi:hypothetical protein [Thermoflavimicrobium dichotomicum]|uniref:Uncharacterized protein n=1 Tax=Thermoflavimicrobium dichotomicum TaxID=46223 RepID=A0A1I3L8W4_9BACL|nr:hypothetical protein [Thermoflavimicrobium dichotomicum]SFI80835.1 hypothetical protein SAMN05421852_10274 [Thermoflavimicrobium dichotomicum]